MGKYKTFGSRFDRVHRNDLNANFAAVEADINAQKTRVDGLIVGTPQPSEVVDSRGGFPVLKDRLDNVTTQLAQIANLGNEVSVLQFGAEPDNPTHDDRQAIIDAIRYIESIGGGKVKFPKPKTIAGYYKLKSVDENGVGIKILKAYGLTLEAESDMWANRIQADIEMDKMISVENNSNSTNLQMKNIRLEGGLSNSVKTNYCFYAERLPNSRFDKCTFTFAKKTCFQIYGWLNVYNQCIFNYGSIGFDFNPLLAIAPGTSNTFINCGASYCGEIGFKLTNLVYSVFNNCIIESNPIGFHVIKGGTIKFTETGAELTKKPFKIGDGIDFVYKMDIEGLYIGGIDVTDVTLTSFIELSKVDGINICGIQEAISFHPNFPTIYADLNCTVNILDSMDRGSVQYNINGNTIVNFLVPNHKRYSSSLTEIYVDSVNGNDKNNGSLNYPIKSLVRLVQLIPKTIRNKYLIKLTGDFGTQVLQLSNLNVEYNDAGNESAADYFVIDGQNTTKLKQIVVSNCRGGWSNKSLSVKNLKLTYDVYVGGCQSVGFFFIDFSESTNVDVGFDVRYSYGVYLSGINYGAAKKNTAVRSYGSNIISNGTGTTITAPYSDNEGSIVAKVSSQPTQG